MQEQELSLKDYVEVIKRRKKTILLIFFIAIIGSAVLSFVLPPVYQVKSTIKIGQIVDLSTFEKVPIESAVASSQFLQGPGLLTDAIRDLNLPFTLKKLRKKVSAEPIGQEEDLVEMKIEMADPPQALSTSRYLTAKLVERHHQIKLQHEDKTALLAQYDEHIAGLHRQLIDVDGSKEEFLAKYDEQVKGLYEQLTLVDIHRKEILTEYDVRIKGINEQLTEIEKDVNETKGEMAKLEEIAEAISLELENRMKDPEPLSEAESWLLVGRTEDITNRIGSYRVNIEIKENRYDALMKESREAQIRKTELLRSIQVESDVLMEELRQVQVKKTELSRDAGEQQDILMLQLREVQTEKAKLERLESDKMYITETIVSAEEPEEPIRPNIPLNIVVAAVIGLVIGLGLVFFLESLEKGK